jgi:hypothetical protein
MKKSQEQIVLVVFTAKCVLNFAPFCVCVVIPLMTQEWRDVFNNSYSTEFWHRSIVSNICVTASSFITVTNHYHRNDRTFQNKWYLLTQYEFRTTLGYSNLRTDQTFLPEPQEGRILYKWTLRIADFNQVALNILILALKSVSPTQTLICYYRFWKWWLLILIFITNPHLQRGKTYTDSNY